MEPKIRNKRVPMAEQIKLINECRRSGLTDADCCREHNIPSSTFYTWVRRCKKAALGEQLVSPRYGHIESARPTQDIVPISVVPDKIEVKNLGSLSASGSRRAH